MADYLTTLILSSHDGPLFVSERSCEARKRASAAPLCHYFTRRMPSPGLRRGHPHPSYALTTEYQALSPYGVTLSAAKHLAVPC